MYFIFQTVGRALEIKNKELLWSVYDALINLNKLKIVFDMNPWQLEIFLREQDSNVSTWKYKLEQLLSFYDVTRQLPAKVILPLFKMKIISLIFLAMKLFLTKFSYNQKEYSYKWVYVHFSSNFFCVNF